MPWLCFAIAAQMDKLPTSPGFIPLAFADDMSLAGKSENVLEIRPEHESLMGEINLRLHQTKEKWAANPACADTFDELNSADPRPAPRGTRHDTATGKPAFGIVAGGIPIGDDEGRRIRQAQAR